MKKISFILLCGILSLSFISIKKDKETISEKVSIKKVKETISQKVEKYAAIPVYLSPSCKLFREPKSSSPSKSSNEVDLPKEMSDKVRSLIIEQMNTGFKTDKFKEASNPFHTTEDWNNNFKGDIYVSIEIKGRYKLNTAVTPATVVYDTYIYTYIYERTEKGFKKIKSPGYLSGKASSSKPSHSMAFISSMIKDIPPTTGFEKFLASIEKTYTKWTAKQFPKE